MALSALQKGWGRRLWLIAALLALAGVLAMIWPFDNHDLFLTAVLWTLCGAVVSVVVYASPPGSVRLAISILLVISCILLGWWGGLFMLPSVVVMIAATIYEIAGKTRSAT